MKKQTKFILTFLVLLIIGFAFGVSVSAYNVTDDVECFSVVDKYNGRLYCSYDPNVIGGTNEEICSMLPYGMHNIGYIESFTIHNGYIYYLTSEVASDGPYQSMIYRCNMDGTNNVYIADNVPSFTKCYIVNDTLYYTTGHQGFEGYYEYDGIAKVNLNTCEYQKIYNGIVQIQYCDENYVYFIDYTNSTCLEEVKAKRINNDGTDVKNMSLDDMEFAPGVIHYGKRYYAYDGGIYAYDWNGKSEWFANDARNIAGIYGKTLQAFSGKDRSCVVAVIDGSVYYREYVDEKQPIYELTRPNAYLMQTNGVTDNQVVAWRFFS